MKKGILENSFNSLTEAAFIKILQDHQLPIEGCVTLLVQQHSIEQLEDDVKDQLEELNSDLNKLKLSGKMGKEQLEYIERYSAGVQQLAGLVANVRAHEDFAALTKEKQDLLIKSTLITALMTIHSMYGQIDSISNGELLRLVNDNAPQIVLPN